MNFHLGDPSNVFQNVCHFISNILKLHHREITGQAHHANREEGDVNFKYPGHLGLHWKIIHPVHRISHLLHPLIDFIF